MRQLYFGHVYDAEEALDALSNQPRAVARWTLLGGAMLMRLRRRPVVAPATDVPEGLCSHRLGISLATASLMTLASSKVQGVCVEDNLVDDRGALALGCCSHVASRHMASSY